MDDDWVSAWLGAPRFHRYVEACDGHHTTALQLYEWNVVLGQALMRDIAHFEIALRNAYDATMCDVWPGPSHWLLDPESPAVTPIWRVRKGTNGFKRGTDVNFKNRKSVDDAIRKCGNANATPGKVIAELSFGFWSHLTTASHEKSLWVPYLHQAYPAGTNRANVDRIIDNLNRVRNRIAHHEPLFNARPELSPSRTRQGILDILDLIAPRVGLHIAQTSTVQAVMRENPLA